MKIVEADLVKGQTVWYIGKDNNPEQWTVIELAEIQSHFTQDLGDYEVDFYLCDDGKGGTPIINRSNLYTAEQMALREELAKRWKRS